MKDLTPSHFRCAMSMSCPSVHELDDGRLAITGELANGGGEDTIIIDPALLANVDRFPSNYKAPDNPYEGIDENYTKPDVISVPQ